MDLVVRTPHGEAEISMVRHDPATRLADLVEVVTGRVPPPVATIDGIATPTAQTIDACGLLSGSVIDLEPQPEEPADASATLVQVAGVGAGAVAPLQSGLYRIGPGRRLNADELARAAVETVSFELAIRSDASATVRRRSDASGRAGNLRIDGRDVPADAPTPWTGGVLDVEGRAFELGDPSAALSHRPAGRRLEANGVPITDGTVTFNRPPARRPDDDERSRRRAAFPDVVSTLRTAFGATADLWRRRPGDDDAFQIGAGLGDLSGDGLASVPIGIDLAHHRGVGVVGSLRFTRPTARALLLSLATSHGPADLDVVVVTHEDRSPSWEWTKWLPHGRHGSPTVITTFRQSQGWVADRLDLAGLPDEPRSGHLTVVVADDPRWWRDRSAPLRALLAVPGLPIRYIALAERAADLPAACSTLISEEPGQRCRVDDLDAHRTVTDVIPTWLSRPHATVAARSLSSLDDPDVPMPVPPPPSTPPVSVGHLVESITGPTARDIAANWHARRDTPGIPLVVGCDALGDASIDLEHDGPHLAVVGAPGSGREDAMRSIALTLAATHHPDDLQLLLVDLADADTFGGLDRLPHVVGNFRGLDALGADRFLRAITAEARREAGAGARSSRLLVMLDGLDAESAELRDFGSTVVSRLDAHGAGIHAIVGTEEASVVTNGPLAPPRIPRLVLRTWDRGASTDLLGVPDAAALPLHDPGHAYLARASERPIAVRTPTCGGVVASDGRSSFEIRPFVRMRDLSPMERRVERAATASVTGVDAERSEVGRLIDRIIEAAGDDAATVRRRPVPDPLPTDLSLAEMIAEFPGDLVPIARVDLPDEQRQTVEWWDPAAGDLLVVMGGIADDSVATATTFVVGGASRRSADEWHVYLITADPERLGALGQLPHVGAVVGHHEHDLIDRLVEHLATGGGLAHDCLVIEGLDRLRLSFGEADADKLSNAVSNLLVERPGGMTAVVTTSRRRAVPGDVLDAADRSWVLRIHDPVDVLHLGVEPALVSVLPQGRAIDPSSAGVLQLARVRLPLDDAVRRVAAEPAMTRPAVGIDPSTGWARPEPGGDG